MKNITASGRSDNKHQQHRLRLLRLAPLLLLFALASSELLSTVIQECVDFDGEFEVGETLELSTDEAAWLRADTTWGPLYRAELTGPDGAALEYWRVGFDSGSPSCWNLHEQLHQNDIEEGEASFEWLGEGNLAIQVTPPQQGVSSDFTVRVEELAAPPAVPMHVIPAAARGTGAKGSFFHTDLWIFNPDDRQYGIEVVLAPNDGSSELRALFDINANQTLFFEDVVASLFDQEEATGMLRIFRHWSASNLTISSRTYSDSGDGTSGQYIPAPHWRSAAGRERWNDANLSRHLLHLTGPPAFRCNIGFAEVFGIDADLEIQFFDASGTEVGGGELVVPASSHLQINDVFNHFDLPTEGDLGAVVTVKNFGRVFVYASVIDNLSSDPIYVPGMNTDNSDSELVIPAAASTNGVYGSRWRTDLRILTLSGGADLLISFIPTDGSEILSRRFEFEGNDILGIDDIVSELGGTGSGALLLTATHSMLATSRTYNLRADGTFGQFVPATPAWLGLNLGTVVGIRRSEDYRSNVGMVWPNARYPFPMVVRLIDDQGRLLGSGRWRINGPQHIQINDIFDALAVPWQDNCRVDFEVADRDDFDFARVNAYASVIDNRTGDAVYMPAKPISNSYNSRLNYDLELDNQRNCLLIDELPQAVGIGQLPSGNLTATVSGEGDIGRPDQPLHVACLFKSADGTLRSAAVPIGGSIENIAGGQSLWCMIPDWKGTGTNHGAATVEISGGDQPVELQLDARANAVHLDSYLETVVAEIPPKETYRTETTGDFGADHLPPQLLVMFDHKEHESLRVKTLVDGEAAEGIDSTHKLLMVLLDWINRDDNTGTTRLEPSCTMRSISCGGSMAGELSWTDCTTTPADEYWLGEGITFEGAAGQRVDIVANWGEEYGRLLLTDPDGWTAADSGPAYEQYESRIDGHLLSDTGAYTIWALTGDWNHQVPYVVELSCEDP